MNKFTCNNCGKPGHVFYQCKLPITSYGLIAFRRVNGKLQYLMIRRRNSFGFIEFIRGKYTQLNEKHIQSIFDEMSICEKQQILTDTFDQLWHSMWGDLNNLQYRSEKQNAIAKFTAIKNGTHININSLVENSSTNWIEPEWEFPKGRRNYLEKDLDCAIREFSEETGYSKGAYEIVGNLFPFEEIFIGSNHKSYKHKYYLAYMKHSDNNLPNFQKTEVSKLEWKTIDECLDSIRPYNLDKKNLITKINEMIETHLIV